MSRAKHHILPFFLPMEGCPGQCKYCDQHSISGNAYTPDIQQVAAVIAAANYPQGTQLAFYGGSFTCLPESMQLEYLNAAAPALQQGLLSGIRISTRPDAVDEKVCRFLLAHGVTTVELGTPSFFDVVLESSGRNCNAKISLQACRTVRQAGLCLGVQLMTGLPDDTPYMARESLRLAIKNGAQLLRVYPTLVLKNTELAQMYQRGVYAPQKLADAVSLCADLWEMAHCAGVQILRMGLNPSVQLEKDIVDGPYHPAFGALVQEEVMQRQIRMLLGNYDPDAPLCLHIARRDVSRVYGERSCGKKSLLELYPALSFYVDDALASGELLADDGKLQSRSLLDEFCAADVARLAAKDRAMG